MRTLQTISFTSYNDEVVILVHGSQPPADEEWGEWIKLLVRVVGANPSVPAVILTPKGKGPNARQRKLLNDVLDSRYFRIAVFSNHRATRAIVTALSWFNAGLRVFAEGDFGSASEYLGLTEDAAARLPELVHALSDELDPVRAS